MTWFNNPKNLWGVWVNTTKWQKIITASCILVLLCLMPFMEMLQALNQLNQLEKNIQQQSEQVMHQQRLVATLKAQTQHNLTPELARQLPEINQRIQKLSDQLQLEHSQWSFSNTPTITLQIRGHFFPLCKFLTALLNKETLQVIQWNITKLENDEQNENQSISSQLILQLNKD